MQSSPKRRVRPASATCLVAAVLFSGLGLAPASAAPAIPSAAEVSEAKDDTATTTALVSDIESILAEAFTDLQVAQLNAMETQGAYNEALVVLDERRSTAERTKQLAAEAAKKHAAAAEQLGELAGDIYRTGGITPDLAMLFTTDSPDEMLYRASAVDGLTTTRTRTLTNAQTAAQTLESLQADAQDAEKAATEAAETAKTAGEATQAAADTAAALVAEKQTERTKLVGQLATLRDTTAALEEQRISGLEQARREAELERVIAASAEAARAEAAAPQTEIQLQAADLPGPQSAATPASAAPAPPSNPAPPAVAPPNSAPPVVATPAPRPLAPTQPPSPPAPAPRPPAPPAPELPAPPAPPAPTPPPPPSNSGGVAAAVGYAMARTGSPYFYAWGGNGPRGYDCSGLVQQAFASAGMSLPRTAAAQHGAGTHVPLSQLQYGDLVFWGQGAGIWHVAIYIGNNQVVNALNPSQGILVTDLSHMAGMGALNPLAVRL